MFFSLTLNIDKNVNRVYNNTDVECLCQNLVDVALVGGRCVS